MYKSPLGKYEDKINGVIMRLEARVSAPIQLDYDEVSLRKLLAYPEDVVALEKAEALMSEISYNYYRVKLRCSGFTVQIDMRPKNMLFPKVVMPIYLDNHHYIREWGEKQAEINYRFAVIRELVRFLSLKCKTINAMRTLWPPIVALIKQDEYVARKLKFEFQRAAREAPIMPDGFEQIAQDCGVWVTQALLYPETKKDVNSWISYTIIQNRRMCMPWGTELHL